MLFDYIEILILTAINSGGIFLIILLLANSLNDRMYRWLAAMIISIIGWVNFAYLGYIEPNQSSALIFYRINGMFVATFLFIVYMFYIEGFAEIRNRVARWAMFIVSLTFVVLILFTDTVIGGVFHQPWGNEIIFGPLNDLFGVFALLVAIGLLIFLITRYYKLDSSERRKTTFFLIGTFLFILSNVAFNVALPELLHTTRYQHFGDYSAVLFMIFTSYAIFRRKFMNVKIALTALFIGVIVMFLLVDIFALSNNLTEQAIKGVIFIFFVGIAVLLVRSVLSEIRQREKLAIINKELAESKAIIQRKAEEQENQLDIMGHELRTPMSIIKLQSGLLRMNLEANKEISEESREKLMQNYDKIHAAAEREIALINTLLAATKIDSGKIQLSKEPLTIIEMIHLGYEAHKAELERKPVKFIFAPPPGSDKWQVLGDKIRLQEVIDNLISNAAKYTNTGEIRIELENDNKFVTVHVKDTGIGIPEVAIKHLGEKFFRVSQYIQQKEGTDANVVRPGGTGLGLYVTFGLVAQHGGKIWVDSKEGVGSTFHFTVPVYQESEKTIDGASPSESKVSTKNIFEKMNIDEKPLIKAQDKSKSLEQLLSEKDNKKSQLQKENEPDTLTKPQ